VDGDGHDGVQTLPAHVTVLEHQREPVGSASTALDDGGILGLGE
jgi:hypothetical protein